MKKLLLALFLFSSVAQAAGEDLAYRIAQKRLDLALSLIEAVDTTMVCESDAYPSTINALVGTAFATATEEQKTSFLSLVPAQSEMRGDLAFRYATSTFSLDNSQSVEKVTAALVGTKYHKFGAGAYGSPYNVILQEGGVAAEMTLELLEEEPWTRWIPSETTWSVRKVENSDLYFPFLVKIGNREYSIQMSNGGMEEFWLLPVGVKEGDDRFYQETLSSSDSYCDA